MRFLLRDRHTVLVTQASVIVHEQPVNPFPGELCTEGVVCHRSEED
jgi:hypothetical protein